MTFSIKQMRHGGEGRYSTQLFSKQTKHMDDDEIKKYQRIVDFIDNKYPDCYNPLRMGDDYICFSTHNHNNLEHTKNDCYDLVIKVQSYTYNEVPKLRIILDSSEKVEAPKKITIQYTDLNFEDV